MKTLSGLDNLKEFTLNMTMEQVNDNFAKALSNLIPKLDSFVFECYEIRQETGEFFPQIVEAGKDNLKKFGLAFTQPTDDP